MLAKDTFSQSNIEYWLMVARVPTPKSLPRISVSYRFFAKNITSEWSGANAHADRVGESERHNICQSSKLQNHYEKVIYIIIADLNLLPQLHCIVVEFQIEGKRRKKEKKKKCISSDYIVCVFATSQIVFLLTQKKRII